MNTKYFQKRCQNELNKRGLGSEYQKRLDRELKVIIDKDFVDYFLQVADQVDYANEHDIFVGPGRGSSAGSLVAFLLNITLIDPLKYGLYFERFLDPARAEFPDIDTDYQKSRRGEVIQYIKDKYGEKNTSHIVNWVKFKPKSLIKDASRIYDIPFKEVNKVTYLIDNDMNLDEARQIREVKDFLEKYPEVDDICVNLEGAIRSESKHAAGIVITPGEIAEYISTVKIKGEICTCFDKNIVEELNLLKADLLGLRTLDVIAEAIKLIRAGFEDPKMAPKITDLLPLEFDDEEVYEEFQSGQTLGIFQFETGLLSTMAQKMQIKDFKTLYAATTAVRPGASNSGSDERYIKKLLGRSPVSYLDPSLESILEETLGEILFQEQIMDIGNQIGGIELTRAYRMIKQISKSKGIEVIESYRKEFVEGCTSNRLPENIAEAIWDIIVESGKYSFNKSHAVSYSALSYWCAWLKHYYPKEFLMAVIHFPKAKKDEKEEMIIKAIRELKDHGFPVQLPNINKSHKDIHIADDGQIYLGLVNIAGCGDAAIDEIISNQPYKSFDDFLSKVKKQKVNAKVLKNIIQSGVFDEWERRDVLYYTFTEEPYEEWDDKQMLTRQMMVVDLPGEKPLIDYYENKYDPYIDITLIRDINFSDQNNEIWIRGIVTDYVTKKNTTKMDDAIGISKTMANFTIDDGTDRVKCFIAPNNFDRASDLLGDGEPVILKGHTFGKNRNFTVDAVLSLTKRNDHTLEEYAIDQRQKEMIDITPGPGQSVNSIMSVTYRFSKNGNPYAAINFEDGEYRMWFRISGEPLRPGEIVIWDGPSDKPFINIRKRIL
jgi:DNA polymerase-3 subunit alpha